LDLDPDPMDLMDLRLTGFGSRSNPSISYTDTKIMESHKEMATKKDEERDRVSLVPLQAGLRAAFGESLA